MTPPAFWDRPAGPLFRDRAEAGRQLARALSHYKGRDDVLVLGLPRGGVPVAHEVARELGAPLDVFIVRKLGVPGHEELAMGAIASGDIVVRNEEVIDEFRINEESVERVAQEEGRELQRRDQMYRGSRSPPEVKGHVVILIDDGLATGSTMRAAIQALRALDPARLVVAVPTGARQTCALLQQEADEVICLAMPEPFYAVGYSYENFGQTTDEEVHSLLNQGARGAGGGHR